MSKIYTTMDINECTCPVCGSTLSEATYFLAKPQVTNVQKSVEVEALKRTTTTTSTTQYSDIMPCLGKICVPCGLKKNDSQRRFGKTLLLVVGGLFLGTICISRFISIQTVSGGIFTLIIILAFIVGIIGLALAFGGKDFDHFRKPNPYLESKNELSRVFVEYMKRSKIPSGYVVFSIYSARKLKIHV